MSTSHPFRGSRHPEAFSLYDCKDNKGVGSRLIVGVMRAWKRLPTLLILEISIDNPASSDMRNTMANKEQQIDEGCIERLANAVETLLLNPSDEGFESAFLSFVPLQEEDFPTKKLRKIFQEISKKHEAVMEKAAGRIRSTSSPSHLDYSFIKGPSRKWFKKKFWQLFRESIIHNFHGV